MIFGWFLCDCKPPGTPNPHAVLPHLLFIFLRSKSERSLVNYPPEILCWYPRMYRPVAMICALRRIRSHWKSRMNDLHARRQHTTGKNGSLEIKPTFTQKKKMPNYKIIWWISYGIAISSSFCGKIPGGRSDLESLDAENNRYDSGGVLCEIEVKVVAFLFCSK